jgi:hypothetical protein
MSDDAINMNGLRVRGNGPGKLIHIPLPRALWREALPGSMCKCPHCQGVICGWWDTLCVPDKPSAHDYTSVCHAPQYHAAEYERAVAEARQ